MVTRTGTHALQAVALLGTLDQGAYAGASAVARSIRAPANLQPVVAPTTGRPTKEANHE